METIVDRVVAVAGHYQGSGAGAESGPFSATLDIEPVLDGMGVTLDYVATGDDGAILHTEHTLLAFDMWSGEATLYVLCRELTGVGQLVQISDSTFSNGRGTDGFELQIQIVLGDGGENGDRDRTIGYVWSWGAPGEPLVEQSRATLSIR